MKLQEFVSETLKEIITGVKEAQEYAAKQDARVSPRMHVMGSAEGNRLVTASNHDPLCIVEFDVAVTSTEGSTKEGGAGIFVAAVGMGAKRTSDTSSSSISHIKFMIPVLLPIQSGD